MTRLGLMTLGIWLSLMLNVICSAAENDFRNVRWGMTKIEVMAHEALRPVSFEGASITYRTMILKKEMVLVYQFVNNKLVDATYFFPLDTDQDRNDIEEILLKKYGPSQDRLKTENEVFFRKWETPTTEIRLFSDKGDVGRIHYTSKKLKAYRLKLERKRTLQQDQALMEQF